MASIKESEHLRIPFHDIQIATKNFTPLIGKGGYGTVYRGELSLSGKLTTVAVKRLDASISGQGFKEFLTEIHLLSRYKHPNLVSLLGFCDEGNEKILVYEHAEHGSLDKFLSMDTTVCPLTYKQKISICIDAARGLDYLHNHVAENHRVIHRDIKSANILLDHNWKAMISDLGLSKIGRANENDTFLITNPCGTHGYCDPVYWDTGVLTKESDVYSFGVVLFEVLCGRLCFMNVNDERRFLDRLAQRYYEKGRLHEIIHPVMKEQLHPRSMNKISEIAYQCLNHDREQRPSMGLVVKKLEESLEFHEIDGSPMYNEEINRMSRPPLENDRIYLQQLQRELQLRIEAQRKYMKKIKEERQRLNGLLSQEEPAAEENHLDYEEINNLAQLKMDIQSRIEAEARYTKRINKKLKGLLSEASSVDENHQESQIVTNPIIPS